MHKKIVIKLTGHLFDWDSSYNNLLNLVNFIRNDYIENNRIYYIVVGGGKYARLLIENMRKHGVNEYLLDEIGIEVSRIHAKFILNLLRPYVYEEIPVSVQEVSLYNSFKKTNIVLGGLSPGFSTNAVSALVYIAVDADVLLTMSVSGGLYDKDPQKYSGAKIIKEASLSTVKKILENYREEAGYYPLLDKTSLKLIEENKINTYIIPPTVDALEEILGGGNPGTRILI